MSLVARSIAAIDGQSVAALLPAIAEYKHQAQKHQDEVAACLDRIGTSPITWRRRRSHSGPPSLGAMATPALLATTNPSSVLLPREGKGNHASTSIVAGEFAPDARHRPVALFPATSQADTVRFNRSILRPTTAFACRPSMPALARR